MPARIKAREGLPALPFSPFPLPLSLSLSLSLSFSLSFCLSATHQLRTSARSSGEALESRLPVGAEPEKVATPLGGCCNPPWCRPGPGAGAPEGCEDPPGGEDAG